MGNSASKKERRHQLEVAEQKYATTASTLATKEKELEATKVESRNATNETSKLKQRCAELDALYIALEQERQSHIANLDNELKQKGDETAAQRLVVESRTKERDEARGAMSQAEEKAKSLEQETLKSREEFEGQRRQLEETAASAQKDLEAASNQLSSLENRVNALEEDNKALSKELLSVKTTAAEPPADEALVAARHAYSPDLTTTKATPVEQLSVGVAAAAGGLSGAQALVTSSEQNLKSVTDELAATKASLEASSQKLDELQRTHNESVSRRAASHEAFTAIKLELVETQQKYCELFEENQKVKKDGGVELDSVKKELAEEREAKEKLRVEIEQHRREFAELQKKFPDAEMIKTVPDFRVQEVHVPRAIVA